MRKNCGDFGVRLFDIDDPNHGIVHVVGPHIGFALPGCTYVCGESHTASCGGVGVWAWGIGTTEVMQVLATQTLMMRRPRTLRASFTGIPALGIYAKDMILALIGKYGIEAGVGHVVEYAGSAIRALPIEGRLTICNMSIEFGARGGLIAADDTTCVSASSLSNAKKPNRPGNKE
jgi:3-isopropylmalate/(R)-2-methylmalate dehydratase large subunit